MASAVTNITTTLVNSSTTHLKVPIVGHPGYTSSLDISLSLLPEFANDYGIVTGAVTAIFAIVDDSTTTNFLFNGGTLQTNYVMSDNGTGASTLTTVVSSTTGQMNVAMMGGITATTNFVKQSEGSQDTAQSFQTTNRHYSVPIPSTFNTPIAPNLAFLEVKIFGWATNNTVTANLAIVSANANGLTGQTPQFTLEPASSGSSGTTDVNVAKVGGNTVITTVPINLAQINGTAISPSNPLAIVATGTTKVDVEQVLGSALSTSNPVPVAFTTSGVQSVNVQQVLGATVSTSNPLPTTGGGGGGGSNTPSTPWYVRPV